MIKVVSVYKNGYAARLGIEAGDTILAVNRSEVRDIIDFIFSTEDERYTLKFSKQSGEVRRVSVRRPPGVPIGLELEPLRIRRCRNRCIFCFVDQMPAGLRPTLYIKDDDFRASFLYGNFVTLCNLTDEDKKRITSQRLSPLYVSVHSTDPKLRSFILGNPSPPDIMDELRGLARAKIAIHAQIVLCPGINDGVHLERTIQDLSGLFPAVASIAVVPVGLTAHRKGLFHLTPVDAEAAAIVLDQVERLGRYFMKEYGTRLVFASDEFYIKAGRRIPSASYYEGFPQIENGVGMVSLFLQKASKVRLPSSVSAVAVTVVTGVSFGPILKNRIERLRRVKGLDIEQVAVENKFFGEMVTVAGLLTGKDIIDALKGRRLGDVVVIPAACLKEDDGVLLDGMMLADLEEGLGTRVVSAGEFRDLVKIIKEADGREQ